MRGLFNHVRQNWVIVAIMVVATLLRVWQLDTQAIFFSDAAKDVFVAAEAVNQRSLPLLGIPSSIPRFKQGPVAIWLEMATIIVAGENLFAISLVFAFIGIVAVITVYELVTIHISRSAGIVAAGILAVSPFAVAHSRMPYHTNPIPLATLFFLWALVRLKQQKPRALFWAVLAWCLAFQFELALLPLIVLIPYVLWRTKQKLNLKMLPQVAAGVGLGLMPQLFFDVTNKFAQLGAFGAWVGYRLGSAVLPGTDHTFGLDNIVQTFSATWLYLGRVVTTDVLVFKLAWFLLLLLAGWMSFKKLKLQKLPFLIEVTWLAMLVLGAGFMIHSSPSEAYFPVFIPLLPIVISYGIFQLAKTPKMVSLALVICLGLANIVGIYQHHFFVSNDQPFSYGPGPGEQRAILNQIMDTTNGNFQLSTTQPGKVFPSYFDNYRWWLRRMDLEESQSGTVVYIEPRGSALDTYPGITKQVFPSAEVYYYE